MKALEAQKSYIKKFNHRNIKKSRIRTKTFQRTIHTKISMMKINSRFTQKLLKKSKGWRNRK